MVAKREHTVNKQRITVKLHYECLGILPPSHDCSTSHAPLPDDVTVGDVDAALLEFIATTCNHSLLDERLAEHHGIAQWEHRRPGEITVKCTLPMSAAAQVKAAWSQDVTSAVNKFLALFQTQKLEILRETWEDFQVRVGIIEQPEDCLQVMMDEDNCTVWLIGKAEPFQAVLAVIGEVTVHMCVAVWECYLYAKKYLNYKTCIST